MKKPIVFGLKGTDATLMNVGGSPIKLTQTLV